MPRMSCKATQALAEEQNHSDLADAVSSCTSLARQLKTLIDGSTQITFLEKADKVYSDMKEAIEKGNVLFSYKK